MPYVIGAACIDVTDRACVEECPVDCIYEGDRKLYIQPAECIDCGACEVACPTEAIAVVHAADPELAQDNRVFFELPLPGRSHPLGMPGGAAAVGPIGVDTELVGGHPVAVSS